MSVPPIRRWILPHILVTGAGSPEVNGVYKLTGKWHDRAPVWSKTSDGVTIIIYRDRQWDGLTFWYIQRRTSDWNPQATSLGTWNGIPSVFYSLCECEKLIFDEASTTGFRVAPPKYNFGDVDDPEWRACRGGVEPGPKIELI
mmetsp:Transcript_21151/g.47723  ORF Transcript_21151/g.47723 Transcript_21151/m.47723 type:complete len:143 (+) Transcript_21151:275-703(+)